MSTDDRNQAEASIARTIGPFMLPTQVTPEMLADAVLCDLKSAGFVVLRAEDVESAADTLHHYGLSREDDDDVALAARLRLAVKGDQ